ncbi:MAG: 50S ribosomal protein L15 [Spirochaetes bacterium]|nr:MAG: 50S ribosomal protein L15 [Spirochaetota bacterium]
MELVGLKKPSYIKKAKRVGRGMSSGHGKTSCRGQKGQMSRSGAKRRPWFEGGQMPLQRRVPKRGFNNNFKTEYQIINLAQLAKMNVEEITPAALVAHGLVKKENELIKILGTGAIAKAIKIYADAYSATARDKIQKAGGTALARIALKTQQ